MNTKPTYLATLSAIALGAARGEQILSAWCAATQDDHLAGTLEYLAAREGAHAAAFKKRVIELGYRVEDAPSERFQQHLSLAKLPGSDERKFCEILGFAPGSDTEAIASTAGGELFDDASIDAETGALLGRYVAEDRDSHRRLRAEFERLSASTNEDEAVLSDIAARLERLSDTLEELKSLRS